jgi:hypothetical protein
MQTVETYFTYEEANEHQITLLAAGIDALVEFVPAAEVLTPGRRAGYALRVSAADADRARELVRPVADPGFASIARCPRCASDDVRDIELLQDWDLFLLGVPSVFRTIRARVQGQPFRCLACGHRYRKKLSGPAAPTAS